MPLKSFLGARTAYFALLIGASLVAPIDMCVAQTSEGRITLVNGTDATLALKVKHLFLPDIIASCEAPPNSTCTTGAIPVDLLDLEASSADGSKRFTKEIDSLVSGENDVWSVSDQSSDGAPGPAEQARFGSALKVTIGDSPYKRNGLFEDMMTDGFLYCTAKKESSYDNAKTYEENVGDLVQHAGGLWVRQHFSSPGEADRSPLMTLDELSMRQDAMHKAEEYLCPGWPGHPGPRADLR
jgi:hypothetical protein